MNRETNQKKLTASHDKKKLIYIKKIIGELIRLKQQAKSHDGTRTGRVLFVAELGLLHDLAPVAPSAQRRPGAAHRLRRRRRPTVHAAAAAAAMAPPAPAAEGRAPARPQFLRGQVRVVNRRRQRRRRCRCHPSARRPLRHQLLRVVDAPVRWVAARPRVADAAYVRELQVHRRRRRRWRFRLLVITLLLFLGRFLLLRLLLFFWFLLLRLLLFLGRLLLLRLLLFLGRFLLLRLLLFLGRRLLLWGLADLDVLDHLAGLASQLHGQLSCVKRARDGDPVLHVLEINLPDVLLRCMQVERQRDKMR
jgi:hypothetical protein